MRIIPVLDLKGGLVVRAAGGRRDCYRPIVSPLSASADAVAVVEGLRRLAAFPTVYVADLDAIAGRPADQRTLCRLARLAEPPEVWLDAGFVDAEALGAALARPRLRPVLGSESQTDCGLLERFAGHPRLVLSLDFFADGYRGPPEILARPGVWPSTVIAMALERVGAAGGPDFARIAALKAAAGENVAIVAAGGVRDAADLAALAAMGIDAALMATALHDGSLTATEIATLEP